MGEAATSYFSGKPCPRGHFERFTSTATCVVCNKRWTVTNPERARAISRASKRRSREQIPSITASIIGSGTAKIESASASSAGVGAPPTYLSLECTGSGPT